MVIAIRSVTVNSSVGRSSHQSGPLDHRKLARLGIRVHHQRLMAASRRRCSPGAGTWLWNSIKVVEHHCPDDSGSFHHLCLRPPVCVSRGKSTILQGMLIFQMFLAGAGPWVATHALFQQDLVTTSPAGLCNTHGGLILAYHGGIALHVNYQGYFETTDLPGREAAGHRWRHPWQARSA